jgi:Ran GTPase-activating protein (RanGAP) involved in mRNA processing and transport
LLQNMPQLQRLACQGYLRAPGVHAFQSALQANRTLKELTMYNCFIGDDGICLLANALVGGNNTTVDILDIKWNYITSNGG